jgi:hypothetical protein
VKPLITVVLDASDGAALGEFLLNKRHLWPEQAAENLLRATHAVKKAKPYGVAAKPPVVPESADAETSVAARDARRERTAEPVSYVEAWRMFLETFPDAFPDLGGEEPRPCVLLATEDPQPETVKVRAFSERPPEAEEPAPEQPRQRKGLPFSDVVKIAWLARQGRPNAEIVKKLGCTLEDVKATLYEVRLLLPDLQTRTYSLRPTKADIEDIVRAQFGDAGLEVPEKSKDEDGRERARKKTSDQIKASVASTAGKKEAGDLIPEPPAFEPKKPVRYAMPIGRARIVLDYGYKKVREGLDAKLYDAWKASGLPPKQWIFEHKDGEHSITWAVEE